MNSKLGTEKLNERQRNSKNQNIKRQKHNFTKNMVDNAGLHKPELNKTRTTRE